jgi:hypothetical protein
VIRKAGGVGYERRQGFSDQLEGGRLSEEPEAGSCLSGAIEKVDYYLAFEVGPVGCPTVQAA